jgi:hypothetical protein
MKTELDLTNRTSLVRTLPHNGIFVEVGVFRGGFSEIILLENKPYRLYLIDSWCEHPGTTWQENDGAAKSDHLANYLYTLEKFTPFNNVLVVRESSVVAAARFDDDVLDVVYIDADHTKAYDDIIAWWPKIKAGGYLCGHDYTYKTWSNVEPDVNRFIKENNLPLILTNDIPVDWPSWVIKKPL